MSAPVPGSTVHAVVPAGLHDPALVSGGNVYDVRVLGGLRARGWHVHEHQVAGGWPWPDHADLAALGRLVADVPDGAVLLVDGLVGSVAAEVLVPAARRLRLVLLLHQSRGDEGEARVASAAAAVVTTSAWTRGLVTAQDQRPAAGVHVAVPGADPAPCAAGTARGDRLLCVGTVTAAKGHGDLADALARLGSRAWTCVCPGSLARDPLFAAELRCRLAADGLLGRVRLPGPWVGAALDRAYAAADLLVLPSRAESYGMVVTEALARGLPVVATDAGGVPEALGGGPGLPGMLVPVGDPVALADALARWLDDPALRGRLRANAVARRSRLAGWEATTEKVAHVLAGVAQDVTA